MFLTLNTVCVMIKGIEWARSCRDVYIFLSFTVRFGKTVVFSFSFTFFSFPFTIPLPILPLLIVRFIAHFSYLGLGCSFYSLMFYVPSYFASYFTLVKYHFSLPPPPPSCLYLAHSLTSFDHVCHEFSFMSHQLHYSRTSLSRNSISRISCCLVRISGIGTALLHQKLFAVSYICYLVGIWLPEYANDITRCDCTAVWGIYRPS
ncbi:hypothetical protein P167DRAFT_308297 [Morchella conica CCBAS932]|uniref:Uncharacterized protein n=1 Tax=Morchella conica CCBAS932 TaxID=1392247 RepID=A0A3N4KLT4_9PEZI|nr:hypothetical protein P167DRAFT_308297 [Morchella conica CCBAS932]